MGKVLISISDDLLARIDKQAKTRGTTRSRFFEEAARHELGWPEPDAMDAALARAREALASYGAFESADLVRGDRDLRDVDY